MVVEEPVFYLVVPCYNEEQVLPETSHRLKEKFNALIEAKAISSNSHILFVDDGSTDKTWKLIENLYESDHVFSGLKLSRNRGHQNALLAGLSYASSHADAIGSMDADLQDDINALDQMLLKYAEGFEVIYGVRNDRSTDSFFKRTTAQAFYKFQSKMGVETVYNHADYRLLSKRAVLSLLEFKEVNLFLRGLVPLIGYKSCSVYYSRGERFAGKSKYTLSKMLSFAVEGITSFSTKPIKFISVTGLIIFFLSIIMLLYVFIGHLAGDVQVGWTSIIMSIWCLGGLQLFAIGIIGEYVGKTYLESKERPRFIIDEILDKDLQDA